jgi:hypothetical protein
MQSVNGLSLTQSDSAYCLFCGEWYRAYATYDRVTAYAIEQRSFGSAMFCSSCGRAIPRDDPNEKRYCTFCGCQAVNREARFCKKCGRNLASQREYE